MKKMRIFRRLTDDQIALKKLRAFWWKPVDSTGFALMRIAYGITAFVTFARQWNDVVRYYSGEGILPHSMVSEMLRGSMRFSILDYVGANTVQMLYIVLLITLCTAAIGLWTRSSLFISTILLFSFHEYGIILLDGGDTMLRLVAFLLLLAPSGRSFSIDNLRIRLRNIRNNGIDQTADERRMPAWPVYLLTWQLVWLYVTSAWMKLEGSTWRWGSAVAITLHHLHFTRLSPEAADTLSIFSPIAGYAFLAAQFAWGLLLVLPLLQWAGVPLKRGSCDSVRRAVIVAGIAMHLSIFAFMNVGLFSFVMMTSYLGLLTRDDFDAMRNFANRRSSGKTVVLFDGRCGLCRRSVLMLRMMDVLHRLELVNFYDRKLKDHYARTIPLASLEQAMHVIGHDGKKSKGFFGFRELCWQIPYLWIIAPFLYLGPIEYVGQIAYGLVARNRQRCHGDVCKL